MFLLSPATHSRAAFSAIRSIIVLRNSRSPSRHLLFTLPADQCRRPISPPLRRSVQPFASLALPSHPLRFDKVPSRLPDWWDDDEDEEDGDNDLDGREDDGGSDPKGDSGRGGGEGGGEGGGGGGGGGEGGGSDWDDGAQKGFLASILAIYTRAINNAPVRTKAISTSLLAFLGDYVAQRLAHPDQTFEWDRRRSASVGIWGFCFMGPVLHSWYGILDGLFLGRFSVWQKLFCDQIFFAPFFNGAFIAGVGSLEGNSRTDVTATLKSKIWPSMKANWTIWPAAQFVNFAFVPKTFQIVYVNCVALVWNAILTYISHDRDEKDLAHGN